MPHIDNNALVFRTDGTIKTTTIKQFDDIKSEICTSTDLAQMLHFGVCAVSPLIYSSQHIGRIRDFITRTVERGRSMPPLTFDMEYDFHRITSVDVIQCYCDEEFTFKQSMPSMTQNPFFPHLHGNVVMLAQCCDEISYTPDTPDNQ